MASDDILHHLNGSSDNSRNLLNEIAQLKKSLAEARTRAAELEEKVERQGKAIAEAEKELLGMDSEYSELRITIEDQYAEIIVLRHELRDAPLDLTREKIGDQYTRNSILNVQPLKRRASDSLLANEPPTKKAASVPFVKVVPCVKCYVHRWNCNDEQPCFNCHFAHKALKCKRKKCKQYDTGLCRNAKCKWAHQGDGYTYLVPHNKQLRRDGLGLVEPGKHPETDSEELDGLGDLGDGGIQI